MRTRAISSFVLGLSSMFAICAIAAQGAAQARTYRVQSGSRVQWVSDAPLERTTGVNDAVSGELTVDPNNLAAARGRIDIDVARFRTGIDLRDEHLRGENWLDAQRFPRATLEITRVEGGSALRPNETVRLTIHGRMTLHGVTREMTAQAQVRMIPSNDELRGQGITGDLIRAQASFDINLSDYDVSISAPVRLKVSNTIRVNITVRAAS